MVIKKRRMYIKKDGKVTIYRPPTNRRLYSLCRACSGQEMRVMVWYDDNLNEFPKGVRLFNDSGWYMDKREALKVAKAFCEEANAI